VVYICGVAWISHKYGFDVYSSYGVRIRQDGDGDSNQLAELFPELRPVH
jgi:hypothetical protein